MGMDTYHKPNMRAAERPRPPPPNAAVTTALDAHGWDSSYFARAFAHWFRRLRSLDILFADHVPHRPARGGRDNGQHRRNKAISRQHSAASHNRSSLVYSHGRSLRHPDP